MSRLGRGQPQTVGFLASALGSPATVAAGGTVIPAGSLRWAVSALRAGGVTPTGTMARTPGRTFAGSMTPSHTAFVWGAGKRVAGTLVPGIITYDDPGVVYDASWLTYDGNATLVFGRFVRAYTGSVAPSGALSNTTILGSHLTTQSLSGGITPTGALVRGPGLGTLAGSITPAHTAMSWAISILRGGSITPTSTLVRKPGKTGLAGSITPSGANVAVQVTIVSAAGSFTPTGTLRWAITTSMSGVMDMAAALLSRPGKPFASAVGMTGSLTKGAPVTAAGSVDMSSTLDNARVYLLNIVSYSEQAGELTNELLVKHATGHKAGRIVRGIGRIGRIVGGQDKPGRPH